jgi:hypothetical protein
MKNKLFWLQADGSGFKGKRANLNGSAFSVWRRTADFIFVLLLNLLKPNGFCTYQQD